MKQKATFKFTKKKTCAFLTLIIMILNMFSPYGVLIDYVYAVSSVPNDRKTIYGNSTTKC